MKPIKTNVTRMLDAKKIGYKTLFLKNAENLSGTEIANIQGEDVKKAYKTLVTIAKSGQHYVFMIPVSEELDLKKAAIAADEKSISMIKSKDLLKTTGYVHGGCSPLGMKKEFKTFIQEGIEKNSDIFFSGGKIGLQIKMSYENLIYLKDIKSADIIVTEK